MDLNQVTVPAQNVEKSVEFYRLLGLRQITDAPHYARFELPEGNSTFSVHQTDHVAPGAGAVVYFETSRLDELVEELKEKGLHFSQEPADQSWLWREARLKDPSGNEICLYYAGENRKNPPWRISPAQS